MGDLIVEQAEGFNLTNSKDFVTSGRPLKFTPEELDKKIQEYFEWCERKKKPLTLERLAVFLNCDRDTILNYSKRDEFFGTIKKLKDYILADKVENLISTKGNVAGQIFDLKNNHDWRDQQDVTLHNEIIPVSIAEEKEIIDITPKKKELKGDQVEEEK